MATSKKKEKLPDAYDQAQGLNSGIYSATYDFNASPTGTAITTASTGELDAGLDVKFDVNDDLYQPSFDFDHDLRKKYPALKDAYDHYQNIKQMCETREREEDGN